MGFLFIFIFIFIFSVCTLVVPKHHKSFQFTEKHVSKKNSLKMLQINNINFLQVHILSSDKNRK